MEHKEFDRKEKNAESNISRSLLLLQISGQNASFSNERLQTVPSREALLHSDEDFLEVVKRLKAIFASACIIAFQ